MPRTGRTESNPAYLIYAESELADASQMTFEQFGMFARLRAIAWREHGLSPDRAELARRLMITPARFAKHAAIVLESFREHEGRLVIPALERARVEQEERRAKASEHGKKGAKGRWDAVPNAGAMPEHTEAMPEHSPSNASAMPSDGYVVVDAVVGVDAKETKPRSPDSGFAFMGVFREAWKSQYGGDLAKGTAKTLKPAIDQHGEAETLRRFKIYVAATEAKYASVPRFVSTFGSWQEAPATTPALLAYSERRYDFIFRHGFGRLAPLEDHLARARDLHARGDLPDLDAFCAELTIVRPAERFRDATKFDRKKHIAEYAALVAPTWKAAA